jgi:hypothetical protein
MSKRKPAAPVGIYPYLVRDPASLLGATWLVLGETFTGVIAVGFQPAYYPGVMMGVVDRVIHTWQLKHYAVVEENSACASLIAGIKEKMLAHGASPLAVQWVNELEPFDQKELSTMAEKLKTKSAGKPAATKTPAKGAAPKKAGNPEALAKAREASEGKRAEMNAKKIKFVGKDVAVRGGSVREQLKNAAKSAKTVGDLKAVELSTGKKISAGDVSWMIDAGIIEYA